jgi:hypothetical protein
MKLLDILTAPWAIEPGKLLEIQAIYLAHARGEKADLAAIEARLGKPLANETKPYTIDQGVAILPIEGIIARRANMFMDISGGASTQIVQRDLQAALQDPAVHSILLAIDSPGGSVDGPHQLGLEARRGFHGHEREDLHHVVLEHVPQYPGLLIVARPVLHPQGFSGGDGHRLNVSPVPDGLEYGICETEHQDILNRLLG